MQAAVAASSAGLARSTRSIGSISAYAGAAGASRHAKVAALAWALTGRAQPPTAGADSSSVSTSSPSGPQQRAVVGGGEPVGAAGKPEVSGFSQGGGAFGGSSNGIPSGGSGGGSSGAGNAGPSASSGGGGSWGSWALLVQTLVCTRVAVFAAWFNGDSVKGGLQSAGNSVQAGLQSAGNSVQKGLKEGLTDAAKEHGSRTARGMGIAAGIGGIFALACVVVQWYLQSRGGGGAAGGRGDINAAIISRLLSAPQG